MAIGFYVGEDVVSRPDHFLFRKSLQLLFTISVNLSACGCDILQFTSTIYSLAAAIPIGIAAI